MLQCFQGSDRAKYRKVTDISDKPYVMVTVKMLVVPFKLYFKSSMVTMMQCKKVLKRYSHVIWDKNFIFDIRVDY